MLYEVITQFIRQFERTGLINDKGRKAIAELLILNDDLRELIAQRASVRSIRQAARANGTRFLREVTGSATGGEELLAKLHDLGLRNNFV